MGKVGRPIKKTAEAVPSFLKKLIFDSSF